LQGGGSPAISHAPLTTRPGAQPQQPGQHGRSQRGGPPSRDRRKQSLPQPARNLEAAASGPAKAGAAQQPRSAAKPGFSEPRRGARTRHGQSLGRR